MKQNKTKQMQTKTNRNPIKKKQKLKQNTKQYKQLKTLCLYFEPFELSNLLQTQKGN
jgi:hypothetical protein